MANISCPYGHMTLKGNWKQEQINALNVIADKVWRSWTYNLDLHEDFSVENLSQNFSGNGRWTFESNLENLGRCTNEEIKGERPELSAAYSALIFVMIMDELSIEVSFCDDEPGNLVLYEQDGVITIQHGELSYTSTNTVQYDYNWRSFIKVNDEGESFAELVEALAEEAGVSSTETDKIREWALDNTYPHSYCFDDLSDEQQNAFKARFCYSEIAQISAAA